MDDTSNPCSDRHDGATDDHGRLLSTTPGAAAWYRRAQRAAGRVRDRRAALQHAVAADPQFTVAAADLGSSPPGRAMTTWERHHCEVVGAATSDAGRAATLLREHLAEVGCDPVALAIVAGALADADTDAVGGAGEARPGVADLLAAAPPCHAAAMRPGR
jgi:hypothetical protein